MIPLLALPIEEGGWGTAGTLKGSVHISGGGGGSRGEGGEGGGRKWTQRRRFGKRTAYTP